MEVLLPAGFHFRCAWGFLVSAWSPVFARPYKVGIVGEYSFKPTQLLWVKPIPPSSTASSYCSPRRNAMSVLPEYEKLHKALEQAIKDLKELTEDQRAQASDELVKLITSAEAESQIAKAIDELVNTIFELDGSFGTVRTLFEKLRASGGTPELVKDINNLLTTWSGYREVRSTSLLHSWRLVQIYMFPRSLKILCGRLVRLPGKPESP